MMNRGKPAGCERRIVLSSRSFITQRAYTPTGIRQTCKKTKPRWTHPAGLGVSVQQWLYIPLQQHLATIFFVNVQSILPFFCVSQQHFDTSFPVSEHVIFAADAVPQSAIAATITNV